MILAKLRDALLNRIAELCIPQSVVPFGSNELIFTRYEVLWPDEWPDSWWDAHKDYHPKRPHALPWWRPFNAFVHCWRPRQEAEHFHDHPRWSITICLKGLIIERTPWGSRLLKPGSIVFRSHKAIHGFDSPEGYDDETWTLFIVGRRKHRQNTFNVIAR